MSKNNKISPLQFGAIIFLCGGSVMLSGGVNGMIRAAGTSAWIVPIISLIFLVLPLTILLYIGNYKPEYHLLEKNIHLFGKIGGHLINTILFIYVFANFVLELWTLGNIVILKYLSITPTIFIGILTMIPILYALTKGLETIARTIEISFLQNIFITVLIFILLNSYVRLDNLKPLLENGFKPILNASITYFSYYFIPFSFLLVLRKNDLTEPKKYTKYFIIFSCFSLLYYVIIFVFIIGSIGIYLASQYVYPEYIVLKEINFIGYLENVENILSIHWFFFIIANLLMSVYFFLEYTKTLLKKINKKTNNYIVSGLAIIGILLHKYIFKNTTQSFYFIRYYYKYIALFILIVYIAITIRILLKKRMEKLLKEA